MKYADKKILTMKVTNKANTGAHLGWAVLSRSSDTGRSEVIKVTDYADADAFVQNDPTLYYKSGPFVLT